jgi:DNA-directed RNA polymerase specialized sigma24 family protein
MADPDSVTPWISRLAEGDPQAIQELWERYFADLVRLAAKRLTEIARRAADEEDVALSAMHTFCRGMAEHRFSNVKDRDDLWKLLVTITARKATAQNRRQFAEKRGAGHVRGESVFGPPSLDDEDHVGIEGLADSQPTPQLACMLVENCRQMLDLLGDETLRQVALLRLEGFSPREIADKLDCVERTVERKLERIRDKWSKAGLTLPNAPS